MTDHFLGRLNSGISQALKFHDTTNKNLALQAIPVETLKKQAQERLDQKGIPAERRELEFKDELIRQLLHWFKNQFFTWVNAPKCSFCAGETKLIGGAHPNQEEHRYHAGTVEVYSCTVCSTVTRFPRYNHPGKLIQTRQGRCGEWAQAFTLCCVALGYEARYVLDFTDHVWTEVYSENLERWVHCDSCENAWDAPNTYESGWGKKLTYIFAYSVDEVVDVTKRYSRMYYTETIGRRTMVPEGWLQAQLEVINRNMNLFNGERKKKIDARRAKEVSEMENNATINSQGHLKPEEQHGRISGSQEWKESRGETGTQRCTTSSYQQSAVDFSQAAYKEFQQSLNTTFEYSKFVNRDTLFFNGSSQLTNERLRLTEDQHGQQGSVWEKKKQKVFQGFETTFKFQITNAGADGFAFVIQDQSDFALGGGGSGLGYDGIRNSLAIEFDTYKSDQNFGDPDNNHISVHTAFKDANSSNHMYSLGCAAGIYNSNLPWLADGSIHSVKISYIPDYSQGNVSSQNTNNLLLVFIDNLETPILSTFVDLSKITDDASAWVGFTAATGGISQRQDIIQWKFQAVENGDYSFFPKQTMTLFKLANFDGIVNKIVEFNTKISQDKENSQHALSDQEVNHLKDLITKILTTNLESRTLNITESELCSLVINKLLRWPLQFIFPVLDLTRYLILYEDVALKCEQQENEFPLFPAVWNILSDQLSFEQYQNNLLLGLRVVCNIFNNYEIAGRILNKYGNQIFDGLLEKMVECYLTLKPNVRHILIQALSNFSVFYSKNPSDNGIQVFTWLLQILSLEISNDANKDSVEETLVAIATSMYQDVDLQQLAATLDFDTTLECLKQHPRLKIELKDVIFQVDHFFQKHKPQFE